MRGGRVGAKKVRCISNERQREGERERDVPDKANAQPPHNFFIRCSSRREEAVLVAMEFAFLVLFEGQHRIACLLGPVVHEFLHILSGTLR